MRLAPMLEYFTWASAMTLLTHAWLAARLFTASPRRRWFLGALLVNWLVLPAAMVAALRAPASMRAWAVPLAHAAFFDVGFCILLVCASIAREVVMAAASLATSRAPDAVARRQALRRALDLAAVSLAGAMSATGYAIALAPPRVRRTRVRIDRAGVRPMRRPLRVVQVSDLHVGPTIRRGYVDALVDAVNALGGDVVVLTGDLVDGFVEQLGAEVAPLARLRAPHGVYFVTGNHEYFYRPHEWVVALGALGITVLSNAHAVLDHDGAPVVLAGLDDPSSGEGRRHDALARAMAGAPPDAPRILLAHRPADAPESARRGFDVQLSGHLHGGQFAPLTWLLARTEPFLAGLYRQGAMWLYVNQGAGYWGPPNRLGARHEVAVIDIEAT